MLEEDLIFWYPVTVQVANIMTASPTIRASWFSFIGNSPQDEILRNLENRGAAIREIWRGSRYSGRPWLIVIVNEQGPQALGDYPKIGWIIRKGGLESQSIVGESGFS